VLEPALKKSKGFDYICLNMREGGKSEQLTCLGRHDRVRLPISEYTRKKLEEGFGHEIDWGDLEGKIRELKALHKSKLQSL